MCLGITLISMKCSINLIVDVALHENNVLKCDLYKQSYSCYMLIKH